MNHEYEMRCTFEDESDKVDNNIYEVFDDGIKKLIEINETTFKRLNYPG